MLTKAELANLETHAVGLFQNVLLPEITPQGTILVLDDGEVRHDPVTTHHLVELCLELDPQFTARIVSAACNWFAKGDRSSRDPFLVTTLARAGKLSPQDRSVLVEQILGNQHPSGFIDLYAGFLDGGSVFSTLWAIRILSLLDDSKRTRGAVSRAFAAVEAHWADVHRASFKGFYCELRWTLDQGAIDTPKVRDTLRELCAAQDSEGTWDNSPVYTAYVLGNLIGMPGSPSRSVTSAVERGLRGLFHLDAEAKGVPPRIASASKQLVESAYLQLCIRASICAVRYLRRLGGDGIARNIAGAVLAVYPDTYHTARALAVELKKMNTQYGEIHKRFAHLDRLAAEILKDNSFERNVFVMMPFRQDRDERYSEIERIIRAELRNHGFRAWLASDKSVAPQLWDNVAAFLLACKYGVAVFTRLEKETAIEEEFNPNVSLELGFCISRGKKVLILKDIKLRRLQTDLVGHLYEEFDLNLVRRQLPKKIRKWVRDIETEEKHRESTDRPAEGHGAGPE